MKINKELNVKALMWQMRDEIIGKNGLDIGVVQQFQKVPKEQQEQWVMNWMNKQMIKQMHEPIYEHFETIWTAKEAKDLIDKDNNYYIEDGCLWYVNDDCSTKFCGIIKEDK